MRSIPIRIDGETGTSISGHNSHPEENPRNERNHGGSQAKLVGFAGVRILQPTEELVTFCSTPDFDILEQSRVRCPQLLPLVTACSNLRSFWEMVASLEVAPSAKLPAGCSSNFFFP